jgi:tetratricopeptide (TPR) repeat protein
MKILFTSLICLVLLTNSCTNSNAPAPAKPAPVNNVAAKPTEAPKSMDLPSNVVPQDDAKGHIKQNPAAESRHIEKESDSRSVVEGVPEPMEAAPEKAVVHELQASHQQLENTTGAEEPKKEMAKSDEMAMAPPAPPRAEAPGDAPLADKFEPEQIAGNSASETARPVEVAPSAKPDAASPDSDTEDGKSLNLAEKDKKELEELKRSDEQSEHREVARDLEKKQEELKKEGKKLEEKTTPAKKPKVWKKKGVQSNAARISVGSSEYLELKALRVMVKVEGLRARTIVDHLFYNPYDRQLQGTFEYRLPESSSICYFAFYPEYSGERPEVNVGDKTANLPPFPQSDAQALYAMPVATILEKEKMTGFGAPKVAQVVTKQKALQAYEETVRQNVDPALVEWAGGNTFSARVFPLQAHNLQRVVIAYEQTLPNWQGQCRYAFSFPDDKGVELAFMLVSSDSLVAKGDLNLDAGREKKDEFTVYQYSANTEKIEQDHAEYLFTPGTGECIVGSEEKDGPLYLFTRLNPSFPALTTGVGAEEAVFLLDTSLSQDPDEFGISLKLMRRILESNAEIKRFNILFFHIDATWQKPDGWFDNTDDMRNRLFSSLEQMLLEGATDIEKMLLTLVRTPWLNQGGKLVDLFLMSNGQATWGDPVWRRVATKFQKELQFIPRFYTYNFGFGTANQEFFGQLSQWGGSSFTLHGESDIANVAMAHKQATFLVENIQAEDLQDLLFSPESATLYPGQQIIATARVTGQNPSITLRGRWQGKAENLSFKLPLTNKGMLAPRAFGEMAVRKMESMDEPALEKTIVAFARHFAVPGKTCSLLMLDRPEDYEKFQIDTKDDREGIKASVNDAIVQLASNLKASLASAKTMFAQFWEDLQNNPLVKLDNKDHIARLIPLIPKEEFELPAQPIVCTLRLNSQATPDYLEKRQRERKNYQIYLDESEVRHSKRLWGDTIRCLSSLVELEPQNTVALRLVGYSLLRKDVHEPAISLFSRVRDVRAFEPQSYRDLAKCYAGLGKYGVAAVYYEIVLAGTWHERFGALNTVVQDEYIRVLRAALKNRQAAKNLRDFLGSRLETLCSDPSYKDPADIIVTMNWNTDNTDVDLWITEPSGEECGYSHKDTAAGGNLLQDITRGYGPERYRLQKAVNGRYQVKVHYYSGDRTKLSDCTFVEVAVTTRAGHPDEKTMNFLVMLNSSNEKAPIAEFAWPPARE